MTDKKEPIQEYRLIDEHPDHDRHLCHITNERNMKTLGELAKNAQFLCVICGRAARKEENLCEPAKI